MRPDSVSSQNFSMPRTAFISVAQAVIAFYETSILDLVEVFIDFLVSKGLSLVP